VVYIIILYKRVDHRLSYGPHNIISFGILQVHMREYIIILSYNTGSPLYEAVHVEVGGRSRRRRLQPPNTATSPEHRHPPPVHPQNLLSYDDNVYHYYYYLLFVVRHPQTRTGGVSYTHSVVPDQHRRRVIAHI